MLRVAERKVVVLDRQDVCEVRAEIELELELLRLAALVLERELILHSLADEALPRNRDHVLRKPARQRIAHEERRGEVLDLPRGEQQRLRAVERDAEPRQEPRVVAVEPVSLVVDVAELVADAEARALEDGQIHGATPSGQFAPRSTGRAP